MFRIQTYITPILLSYVDKYIKDFKTDDIQVSLWQGSVSLHNLELRPDAILDELNLPFTLTSGHIYELLIQVPWMKIVSEPIVITINTIECVLKLLDGTNHPRNVTKPNKETNDIDAPPGYIQSLVNKIVTNISFHCHNVILKYVEDDIVVSVNIKQFYLNNVDGNWIPKFAEITPEDLHIRKLINLSDITLCLDKRNAAGKIEMYLEPLLYKCEVELRLDSIYTGILNKRPESTRIHITSPKLEFNFSYQQIPMFLRIMALFIALKQKRLKFYENNEHQHDSSSKLFNPAQDGSVPTASPDNNETWTSWMWSFVQPFPLGYNDEEKDASLRTNPILLLSVNFEVVTFTFKIPDFTSDTSGIFTNNQRKFRYTNLFLLELKSILCESSSHGLERFCFRGGIESIVLYPESACACGILDNNIQGSDKRCYVMSTNSEKNKQNFWPVEYNASSIVQSMNCSEMLDVCPALAIEYMYHLSIPEDFNEHSINLTNLEYSNFKEDLNINIAIGVTQVYLCSGFFHRISLLDVAAKSYDYPSYSTPKLVMKPQDLPPPTTDDYDALIEHIPKISIKLTTSKIKIYCFMWDHFASVKQPSNIENQSSNNLVNRRKTSSTTTTTQSNLYFEKLKNMPCILLEINTIYGSILTSMYPNRLTYVSCQLPEPPGVMQDSCYKYMNLDVLDLQAFLVHKCERKSSDSSNLEENSHANEINMPFITQCNFHLSSKKLILPEFWTKSIDIIKEDYNFNIDNITVCLTVPKMLTLYYMLYGMIPMNSAKSETSDLFYLNVLLSTTLLEDTFSNTEIIHLDMNFEGLSGRSVYSSITKTYRVVLNGLKVFAIESIKEHKNINPKQAWIFSAPENSNRESNPYLKAVLQISVNENYSTFFTIMLEECSFIMDPLFYQWLMYYYRNIPQSKCDSNVPENLNMIPTGHNVTTKRQSRRSLEEIVNRISGSSRNLSRLSLGHSSSDREKDFIHGSTQTASQPNNDNLKEATNDQDEKTLVSNRPNFFNKMIRNIFKWKNMALYLESKKISIYFPLRSISAVNLTSLSDAIREDVQYYGDMNHEDIFVFSLPNTILKSTSLKKTLLSHCIYGLPVKLPVDIWDYTKISYPWTITFIKLGCYSISQVKINSQYVCKETNIIKPVSTDVTISFTPKLRQRKISATINESSKRTDDDINDNSKNFQRNSAAQEDRCISEKKKDLYDALTAIGICIHIDTEIVQLSINYNQMNLIETISHSMQEFNTFIVNINNLQEYNMTEDKKQNSKYCKYGQHSNDIVLSNLEEDYSKDSDLPSSSGELTESGKQCLKIDRLEHQCEDFNITIWLQWTISRLSIKAYSFASGSSLKLVFSADDIVSSLDIQNEYIKWKTKIVTAGIHHFKRVSNQNTWLPGKFSGIIMRGRDNIKRSKPYTENCFITINITKAKCSSVHNKWRDVCKVTPRAKISDKDYISEIEISLQALDIIFNLQALKPFIYLFSTLTTPILCENSSTTKNDMSAEGKNCAIAKMWDSRNLPLCYFEGSVIRIFIPIEKISQAEEHITIFMVEKVSISSVAENPVCRSPLRPDLYQQAAKKGYLVIPGSEIEDRQCQLLLKGICLQTAEQTYLEKLFDLEVQSQSSVNPALQWNDSLLRLSNAMPMNIMEKVDVCIVIALAIIYKSELICGPTIDVNIITDIELSLSTAQVILFQHLLEEFVSLLDSFKKMTVNSAIYKNNQIDLLRVICPHLKKCNKIFKTHKGAYEHDVDRNSPRLSIDTGIASDKMSYTTINSKASPKAMSSVSVKNYEKSYVVDYYDAFVTFGKVNLILFEKIDNCEINSFTKLETENELDKDFYSEKKLSFKTKALINIILLQPNYSHSRYNNTLRNQFSLYHAFFNLGDDYIHQGPPKANDFLLALFETKIGVPDSVSDISPNLLTVKWERIIGNKISIKADVKCPIRITASLDRINKLNSIKNLFFTEKNLNKTEVLMIENTSKIRDLLNVYEAINISMVQTVLALNIQDNIDYEILLNYSNFNLMSVFNSRQEKNSNKGLIDSFCVTLRKTDDLQSKILIYPWTLGFNVNLSWNSLQNIDSAPCSPVYQIYIETDKLLCEFSAEHSKIITGIFNYYKNNESIIKGSINNLIAIQPNKSKNESKVQSTASLTSQDQHYKDDLRAGAFKFVQCDTGTPLPYQVFIGSNGLTWRYPQPRAITCVHSFPVPFQLLAGDSMNVSQTDAIPCTLEYYSDVTKDFSYYAKFHIRQDKRCKLQQAKFGYRTVLSSMWRVVMHFSELEIGRKLVRHKYQCFDKNKYIDTCTSKCIQQRKSSESDTYSFPISPNMLAACLRIDSFYTPYLLPSLQVTCNVSTIEVNLFNFYRHRPLLSLLTCSQLYHSNGVLPVYHVFCSIIFQSIQIQSNMWNDKFAMLKLEFDSSCDVINGSNMLLNNILSLKDVSILSIIEEDSCEMDTTVHMNNIVIHCGPQHIHALNTSYQIWKDILYSNTLLTVPLKPNTSQSKRICNDCSHIKPDMVIPAYIVGNDTNLPLRFGQLGTDESVVLEPRKSHLYSWKWHTQQELCVTINSGSWKLSKSFKIEKPGASVVQIYNEDRSSVSIVIVIENISPIHKSVMFMGQLIFFNILSENFDVKIFHNKALQLHGVLGTPSLTLESNNRSPSIICVGNGETTLRLHFTESDAGWSGDVPVKESKGNMPWLVKVPNDSKTQYTSIWCRVIKNNSTNRTLVILSPLYIVKSHLPTEISIDIESEDFECETSKYLFEGKGTLHVLNCPGTKSTKHHLTFNELNSGDSEQVGKISLSYEVTDNSFFPSKLDNPDIDKLIYSIKQWLEYMDNGDTEWPYLSIDDGIKWKPIYQPYSTHIHVQYLPTGIFVDSLILDISPWALLGNCSGLSVSLLNSNKESMCKVNHEQVVIPPIFIGKEQFYFEICHGESTFGSDPITINPKTPGPYEKLEPGNVSLDCCSDVFIKADDNVYVFTMGYEIKEKINLFKLSAKFTFINRLTNKLMVLPLAIPNLLNRKIHIPSNASDYLVVVKSSENSNVGTPINRFCVLHNSEIENEEYNLYICCSASSNMSFSCPIRIDKFYKRKSIVIKEEKNLNVGTLSNYIQGSALEVSLIKIAIPVIITFHEYKGHTFIMAYNDTSPQFLIRNNSDVSIAIAQVLQESIGSDMYTFTAKDDQSIPQLAVNECEQSDWYCVIEPNEETYYTVPSQNSRYPELYQSSADGSSNYSDNLYLTFAYIKETVHRKWSVPVIITSNNLEQFVKLPGYKGDIKVMIENHCYSTIVTINNVTQDDISASDIRQRLLATVPIETNVMDDFFFENNTCINKKLEFSGSNTKVFIDTVENEILSSPTVSKNSKSYTRNHVLRSLKLNTMCNKINIILCSNKEANESVKTNDVISFVSEKLTFSMLPSSKCSTFTLTMGEFQIDNPLYLNGGYDFNVVLVRQHSKHSTNNEIDDWKSSVLSMVPNVADVFKEIKKDGLINIAMEIELWDLNDTVNLGCKDLNIIISPISVYLEDTYISTLTEYITDFIPSNILIVTSDVDQTLEATNDRCLISVPEYVLWEGYGVSYPMKLKRLCIQPLNILLSVHSTMLFYLALDHSPLQFAEFERTNILTSSYTLGRAMMMHYLTETVFLTGWVVGSLEILGSPGGLAKRLSMGIRDLVREPCLGLMRGPWGFIVGMTHGSVSLLKHFTQGTVESMSMVMGSVARNLDRLTLDEEYVRRTGRINRHRPSGLIPALTQGFQGLGLSLLGAVGGIAQIAHTTLLSSYEQRINPAAVAAGLTRGIVGVITKPLSATADLLALTGQGLIQQAGWNQNPNCRYAPLQQAPVTQMSENFRLKLGNTFSKSSLLYICQGIDKDTGLDVTLLVTNTWLIILDTFKDKVVEMDELEKWRIVKCNPYSGELILGVKSDNKAQNQQTNTKLETEVQMDPILRARIAAYVGLVEEPHIEEKLHRLIFPAHCCSHCATMLNFAKCHNQGFLIL